jgi:uncharacterized repeat protein (TIGR03803 family)
MRQKRFWFTISGILAGLALALILPAQAVAASKYKVLYRFKGDTDGATPNGLIFDAAGNLYGTTWGGGNLSCNSGYGCGTVFELKPNSDGSWTESVLHRFTGGGDGSEPLASLILDPAGNLYGTTYGGASGYGVVFKLTPNADGSWTESVLLRFDYTHGENPNTSLIFDLAGNLYGTTEWGGAYNEGTVFKLTPNTDGSWTYSLLHRFTGANDGANPSGDLIFDTAGNLYGTTSAGGNGRGFGTVFKLKPNADGSWTESVLHSFGYHIDGAFPNGVIFDKIGNLYGTTLEGGGPIICDNYPIGCGVVFKVAPNSDGSWTESVLHRFEDKPGRYPHAGLIFDAVGNLYGTTQLGGPADGGVVFKLAPQSGGRWGYSALWVFQGKPALFPSFLSRSSLTLDKAGNLYGTTDGCGSGYNCWGVVFELTP